MSQSSNDTVVLTGEAEPQQNYYVDQPPLPRELSTNTVCRLDLEEEEKEPSVTHPGLERTDSADTVVRMEPSPRKGNQSGFALVESEDEDHENSTSTVVRMETSHMSPSTEGPKPTRREDPSISLPAPVVPGRPADLRAQLNAFREAPVHSPRRPSKPVADKRKSDSKRDSEVLAMEGEELLFVATQSKTREPTFDDLEASVLAMNDEDLLFVASRVGDLELVEAVIGAGADVDTRDDVARRTPLMVAAENGHVALVELLCDLGAEVNARDQGFSAQTALTRAIIHGHANVVRKLIECDASPDLPDATSKTPLMYTVMTGRVDLCVALLELGCQSVNTKDMSSGFTALMFAARDGNLRMCKALCDPRKPPFEHEIRKVVAEDFQAALPRKVARLIVAYAITDTRADWNLKSKTGKTARGLALQEGHKHISRYLSSAQNRKDIMERERWGGSPRGSRPAAGGAKIQRGYGAAPRNPQKATYRTPVARYR